jgi:hypothetical protein
VFVPPLEPPPYLVKIFSSFLVSLSRLEFKKGHIDFDFAFEVVATGWALSFIEGLLCGVKRVSQEEQARTLQRVYETP